MHEATLDAIFDVRQLHTAVPYDAAPKPKYGVRIFLDHSAVIENDALPHQKAVVAAEVKGDGEGIGEREVVLEEAAD